MGLIVILAWCCIFGGRHASATPFYLQLLNATNGPMTGQVTIQGWPQSSWWSMYGTNAIYTGFIITNTPNGSGFFSNWLYPGTYRVQIPTLNTIFYVNIPDTTNYENLMMYGVAVPATETALNSYGLVTNLLGFGPATNSFPMLVAAMGYTPMPASAALTNLAEGGTISVTNQGVISEFDAFGDFLRSNTVTGNWFFQDSNGVSYYDGVLQPTNTTQLTNGQGGLSFPVMSFTSGQILETNAVWPPTNIPPYTGVYTNYWHGNSNGIPCLVWTNNGSSTIGIYYTPVP